MGGLVFCVVAEFLGEEEEDLGEEEGDDCAADMMRERKLIRTAWVR
jgi:hypothetical protein